MSVASLIEGQLMVARSNCTTSPEIPTELDFVVSCSSRDSQSSIRQVCQGKLTLSALLMSSRTSELSFIGESAFPLSCT